MRITVAASCVAIALAAAGCSHANQTAVEPPTGVASMQTMRDPLEEQGRVALLDAQREEVRLERLHDESDDEVVRGAIAWQIDGLHRRIGDLLDTMTALRSPANAAAMREDIVAVERETNQSKNTDAWAQREVEPRTGNAETMPESPAPWP